MKTTTKLVAFLLLSTISFSGILKSEEMSLPVIQKPSILEEGTQRELTLAQVAELLPWAKDSKNFLVDLLDNVQGLTTTEKVDRLVEGIKYVVIESAPKNSELLMRYALNRALVINDVLKSEILVGSVGSDDAKARVLTQSINMALKYYDADIATLTDKKVASPFAQFGIDYFSFLTELNKSIFDASAQYNVQRISLEWLQWDLYRDLNNTIYAAQILKINNSLKMFPATKLADSQSLSYIRQMKKLSQQLNINVGTNSTTSSGNHTQSKIFHHGENYGTFYSSYYSQNKCYKLDTKGNKLGGESDYVNVSHCATGYKTFYSNYYSQNMCYQVDSDDNRMGAQSDYVNVSHCVTGFKTFYSNYYSQNKCYQVDADDNRMGAQSDYVNVTKCTTGYKTFYSSYYSKNLCYYIDADENRMGAQSDYVNDRFCQ
jgi:hypothetical protein